MSYICSKVIGHIIAHRDLDVLVQSVTGNGLFFMIVLSQFDGAGTRHKKKTTYINFSVAANFSFRTLLPNNEEKNHKSSSTNA